MMPNTSVVNMTCVLPVSSGRSSSKVLFRATTISCAFGAEKFPYTALVMPPPVCRVRL